MFGWLHRHTLWNRWLCLTHIMVTTGPPLLYLSAERYNGIPTTCIGEVTSLRNTSPCMSIQHGVINMFMFGFQKLMSVLESLWERCNVYWWRQQLSLPVRWRLLWRSLRNRQVQSSILSQLGLICVGGWGRTYTCCTLHALTCACDEWSVVGFYVRLLRLFTDIDECLSQPCQNAANCTDVVSGFECTCVSGYTGLLCETGM